MTDVARGARLEQYAPVDVQDLVLHSEATDDGPWYDITVYFARRE